MARQQNNFCKWLDFFHLPHGFNAIHSARHLNIQNDRIKQVIFHDFQRFFTAGCTDGIDVTLHQPIDQRFQKVLLVIHHQNLKPFHSHPVLYESKWS